MSKGKKHTCFKCNMKFYDLNLPDAICPKCRTDQKYAPIKVEPPAPAWVPYFQVTRVSSKLTGRRR